MNASASGKDQAGEKFWRMPLDDEYKEVIRSGIADIVNSGGRWGGAITAAMFLKEFAERHALAAPRHRRHPRGRKRRSPGCEGAVGDWVRSLVEFVKEF